MFLFCVAPTRGFACFLRCDAFFGVVFFYIFSGQDASALGDRLCRPCVSIDLKTSGCRESCNGFSDPVVSFPFLLSPFGDFSAVLM